MVCLHEPTVDLLPPKLIMNQPQTQDNIRPCLRSRAEIWEETIRYNNRHKIQTGYTRVYWAGFVQYSHVIIVQCTRCIMASLAPIPKESNRSFARTISDLTLHALDTSLFELDLARLFPAIKLNCYNLTTCIPVFLLLSSCTSLICIYLQLSDIVNRYVWPFNNCNVYKMIKRGAKIPSCDDLYFPVL